MVKRRRVKSKTDVITNSSSEVFILRSYGRSAADIQKELESVDSGQCSGVGGDLDVYDNTMADDYWGESYDWIPDGFVYLDIDQAKEDVIDYLLKNFYVLDSDYFYIKDDNGRLIRRPTKDEWEWIKKLKSEERETYAIIDHMESWASMVKLKEGLKDEEAYFQKIKKHWNEADKDERNWLLETYGTPEGELTRVKDYCKRWFEKHPTSPAELYKYDMNKPLE